MKDKLVPILLSDLWKSPEFEAFAKKIGIDVDLPTQFLQITFNVDDYSVRVRQEFMGVSRA